MTLSSGVADLIELKNDDLVLIDRGAECFAVEDFTNREVEGFADRGVEGLEDRGVEGFEDRGAEGFANLPVEAEAVVLPVEAAVVVCFGVFAFGVSVVAFASCAFVLAFRSSTVTGLLFFFGVSSSSIDFMIFSLPG